MSITGRNIIAVAQGNRILPGATFFPVVVLKTAVTPSSRGDSEIFDIVVRDPRTNRVFRDNVTQEAFPWISPGMTIPAYSPSHPSVRGIGFLRLGHLEEQGAHPAEESSMTFFPRATRHSRASWDEKRFK